MKRLIILAAVVLVVLMVHGMGVSAVNVSPLVSCEPDCATAKPGDKVVNPHNCSQFYYCNDGIPWGPVPCDTDEYFNTDTNKCEDNPSGDDCLVECSSASNICQLQCNGTFDIIADATNCSVYYICTAGQVILLECPKDRPHFDDSIKSCVNNASVCCSGYCVAYCDGGGFSIVPDPKNCTQFYICDDKKGEPDEDHRFYCEGGYFSVQLGSCVSGTPPDPCPTLCGDAGGGSSTTTTTITPSSSTTTTTTTPSSSTTTTTTTPSSSTTTTTTTPSSTTTTTTTTPGGGATDINGCVSSLVCTDEGYFPTCSTCQREYFSCSGAGALGVMSSCPGDTVFNPTSGYSFCILPSNCPYQ